jgi:hypothetical protein
MVVAKANALNVLMKVGNYLPIIILEIKKKWAC